MASSGSADIPLSVSRSTVPSRTPRRVPVKFLRNPGVHAKAILVDGRKAYVGSINLSRTSISETREIGLITKERPVLDTISRTFDTDWANATSF